MIRVLLYNDDALLKTIEHVFVLFKFVDIELFVENDLLDILMHVSKQGGGKHGEKNPYHISSYVVLFSSFTLIRQLKNKEQPHDQYIGLK